MSVQVSVQGSVQVSVCRCAGGVCRGSVQCVGECAGESVCR